MNIENSPFQQSLPLVLPVLHKYSRRHRIEDIELNDSAVHAFNEELQSMHEQAPIVQVDQVVSLARWLQTLSAETAEATIHSRLSQADLLRRMLQDADWNTPASLAQRAERLLRYVTRTDDLIPDDMPVLGHLDDALLVEMSWPEFAGEAQDYRDFCQFRATTDFPRGSSSELRAAWESHCLAEANALLHRQLIRDRGYARVAPLSGTVRVY